MCHKPFFPQEGIHIVRSLPMMEGCAGGGDFGEIVSLLLLLILMRPLYPLWSSCLASSQVLPDVINPYLAIDLLYPGRRLCSGSSCHTQPSHFLGLFLIFRNRYKYF